MGTPVRLGVIAATTTKNNTDTGVPFNNTGDGLERLMLQLQPDAACYVRFGSGASLTVASTTYDVVLEANQIFTTWMAEGKSVIACLGVSGNANLVVCKLVV